MILEKHCNEMKFTSQPAIPDGLRQVLTLIAILATLAVNALSNFFPPRGLNIGEVSNTILGGVLITPASYAFSIWGLIYLGLIAFGIYQLLPGQRRDELLRRADYYLIVACLAQIAWVYLFLTQQFWLSVVAMGVILGALIGAYLALGVSVERVSRQGRWFAHIPFSIYLGWISVASIVNVASALYISEWGGWGVAPAAWTVVMLVVGVVLAAIVVLQRADVAYGLVFVWAYGAIAVRQSDIPSIWITAAIGAVILVLLAVFSRIRSRRLRPNPHPNSSIDSHSSLD